MGACHQRAVAHRERHVGLRQHGCIVDAVADHRDALALRLQLAQSLELSLGRGLADGLRDSEAPCQAAHALGAVA